MAESSLDPTQRFLFSHERMNPELELVQQRRDRCGGTEGMMEVECERKKPPERHPQVRNGSAPGRDGTTWRMQAASCDVWGHLSGDIV